MSPIAERRERVMEAVKASRRLYQFGQPQDTTLSTAAGRAGCGPACVQVLARIWQPTAQPPTQDRVCELSGFPEPDQHIGSFLRTYQLVQALMALGIRYEPRSDLASSELQEVAKHRGPVLFLCRYTEWPQWRGYRCQGAVADGHPNGYASPLGRAGKTQLSGFDGGHYGLLLSSRWMPRKGTSFNWLRDPNHSSPARPERPSFDIVSKEQFRVLFESGRSITTDGQPWAAIPTEVL